MGPEPGVSLKPHVRRAVVSDAGTLIALYRDTVRTVNAADYSPDQLRAWAPDDIPKKIMEEKIRKTAVFVTEDHSGITAMGSLEGNDYLDMLFVRHDRQRRGLARLLMTVIEETAREAGASELTADVSITAKPLFVAGGFSVIKEQLVELRGQTLKNFKMRKILI